MTIQNWKSKLRYFPIKSGEKKPAEKGWQSQATNDESKISLWRSRGNLGIACGSDSDLLVVDVDPDKGGIESLAKLVENVGKPFPSTYEVKTGGGGSHYYFRHPLLKLWNAVSFLPGLDIRTTGGLVVAPGSMHSSGNLYEIANDVEPIYLDDDFLNAIERLQASKRNEKPADFSQIKPGERNEILFRLGSALRAKGLSKSAIEAALIVENREKCKPPLTDDEVKVIAVSSSKYDPNKSTKLFLNVRRASEITATAVEWLWPGFLPIGKNALGIGQPGSGKSTATFDFIACAAAGRPWPDGSANLVGPIEVLLVTFGEDTYDDVVVPALMLRGLTADEMYRVWCIDGLMDEEGKPAGEFNLQHLNGIEEFLDDHPAVRLFIVNPLASGFGKGKLQDAQDVRAVLDPLGALAARRKLANWVIHHDKKGIETSAVNKVSGSQQLAGAARVVFYFVKGKHGEPSSMASAKANLSGATGMKFEIVKAPHPLGLAKDPHNVGFAKLNWLGKETKSADELLDDSVNKVESKVSKCRQYLKAALAVGPQPREQIYIWADGLDDSHPDANRKVMQRAAKSLGIDLNQSNWSLPKEPPVQQDNIPF